MMYNYKEDWTYPNLPGTEYYKGYKIEYRLYPNNWYRNELPRVEFFITAPDNKKFKRILTTSNEMMLSKDFYTILQATGHNEIDKLIKEEHQISKDKITKAVEDIIKASKFKEFENIDNSNYQENEEEQEEQEDLEEEQPKQEAQNSGSLSSWFDTVDTSRYLKEIGERKNG